MWKEESKLVRDIRTGWTARIQDILQTLPTKESGQGPEFPDVPNKQQKMDQVSSFPLHIKREGCQQHQVSLAVVATRTDQKHPDNRTPAWKAPSMLDHWAWDALLAQRRQSIGQGDPTTSRALLRSTVSLLGKRFSFRSWRQAAGWSELAHSGPHAGSRGRPSNTAGY